MAWSILSKVCRHHYHPTGKEKEYTRQSSRCALKEDVIIEIEGKCCFCSNVTWKELDGYEMVDRANKLKGGTVVNG